MATSSPVDQKKGRAAIGNEKTSVASAAVQAAQVALRELREEQAGLDYERIQRVKARQQETAR
jgi:hypothetical protein